MILGNKRHKKKNIPSEVGDEIATTGIVSASKNILEKKKRDKRRSSNSEDVINY